jgi:hypothetical protein
MILANGASHDCEERVMLRRFSLEMRVEVGKREQGRERGRLIVEFGHKSGSDASMLRQSPSLPAPRPLSRVPL